MNTLWKSGDIAILIGDREYEKVEIRDSQNGLASVRVIPQGEIRLVDPASLFPLSVINNDTSFELARAGMERRLILSEAARLTHRRASNTNISIYEDAARGRVISIREGGSREACFDPAGLLLRWELASSLLSSESRLGDLFEANFRTFLAFFEKCRGRFPTGNIQIWGAEHGSDVE